MKRAAAQNQGTILQGERSLSADNFSSPAFFCSKSAAPITYIKENGKKRKGIVSGTYIYVQTGREADIAAKVARILIKGDCNG